MYTLYHLPGSCSLATLTFLLQLEQPVNLVHRNQAADYQKINPLGAVPALTDEHGAHLLEGGAIMLHLLHKYDARWQAMSEVERQAMTQNVFFANATVHPAYNRLFFLSRALPEGDARQSAYKAAAEAIEKLWQVVESKLEASAFLSGDSPSAPDIMLAVYSRWATYFPVSIAIGDKGQKMIDKITALPSFQRALEMEADIQ